MAKDSCNVLPFTYCFVLSRPPIHLEQRLLDRTSLGDFICTSALQWHERCYYAEACQKTKNLAQESKWPFLYSVVGNNRNSAMKFDRHSQHSLSNWIIRNKADSKLGSMSCISLLLSKPQDNVTKQQLKTCPLGPISCKYELFSQSS